MKLSEFKPTEEVIERAGRCTTAEEVEKLAQEYDVELTAEEIAEVLKYNNLKELNDEQLGQVAGGDDWGDQKAEHLPKDHGRHIGKYEAEGHIGEAVYCVDDSDPKQFCWGILQRSYEQKQVKSLWGDTVRCHDILVQGWNDWDNELTFYSLYRGGPWDGFVSPGNVFDHIMGNSCTLFLKNK